MPIIRKDAYSERSYLQLEQVKTKFNNWRKLSGRPHKIPSELWASAAQLISDFSLHRISKELSISYTVLKEYAQKFKPSSGKDEFVEIKIQNSVPIHAPVREQNTLLAEVISEKGNLLRIYSERCAGLLEAFLKS